MRLRSPRWYLAFARLHAARALAACDRRRISRALAALAAAFGLSAAISAAMGV
jgi:hypothetical protein